VAGSAGNPRRNTEPAYARVPVIGRDVEVRRVVDLLREADGRLVTVTGAAGVGKSVVADEAIRRFLESEPVSVQRLTAHGSAGVLASESIEAVLAGGAPPVGPASARPRAGRTRLVLIDGAEALPDAALAVSFALDHDPDLIVLATSLMALNVRGERVVRLAPLKLPPEGERNPTQAAASPAVRLFCDRLAELDAAFELTAANTQSVVDLCRYLDGLPLALELAAARCATMRVDTVLHLLHESAMTLLTGGAVDAQDRHRSLRETIRWSYDLLDWQVQALLSGLAVFSGPVSTEAIVAVALGSSPHTDRAWLADALSILVTTGLVTRVAAETGEQPERFALPATIRQFALEGVGCERTVDLRNRHAHHYRNRAHEIAEGQHSFGGARHMSEFVVEQSEFLAALDLVATRNDPAAAMTFATDLQPLWIAIGATEPGARHLDTMLERARAGGFDLPAALEARAIAVAVALTMWTREPDLNGQESRLDDAIACAEHAERPDVVLHALDTRVQLRVITGDTIGARATVDTAMAIADELDDDFWRMTFLSWSAIVANMAGDPPRALRDGIVSRDLARAAGDEERLLMTSHVLAGVPHARTDPDAALPSDEDLLDMARRLGNIRAEGMILIGAATRCAAVGDPRGAAEMLAAALDLARRTDLWFLEELSLFTLVITAVLADKAKDAARLHGALHDALPAIRAPLPVVLTGAYDAMLSAARASLGDTTFRRLEAGGRLLTWRDALSLAHAIASAISRAVVPDPADAIPTPCGLSRRELEVLQLISSGCSNKEVAALLHLRPKTVMHYTSSIYRKLGARGRAEAVALAWRDGWLDGANLSAQTR
jgi:predicted ATPase/DNA-binding CsgD family transcriptional regulator